MVPGEREADPLLLRPDHVVAGEIGMRGTDRILQAEAHQDRALDPVRKVLDIEITEGPVQVLIGNSLLAGGGQHFVGRPLGNLEIIREIGQERNEWSDRRKAPR